MKWPITISFNWLRSGLLTIILGVSSLFCLAQNPTDSVPPDPGAISVYTMQNLSFGAFSNGPAGGSISISANGIRSVSGDVMPLNLGVQYYPASFDIDAPEGSIISMLNGSNILLTGSNGGSITLELGDSDPPSPFITTVPQPLKTQVNIGGKLTIGNPSSNPPGTYTGTFYITFNQE